MNRVGWLAWLMVLGSMQCVAAQSAADPKAESKAESGQVATTLLLWQEQEPGVEPYPSRMLVTPAYLRSDEGHADSDYLLFDRKTRQIFNVMHESRSVLVIDADQLPDSAGSGPKLDIELREDPQAPRISGQAVRYFRVRHDGKLCAQATVVPNLLPEVTAAMRELRAVLTGRQYRDLYKTPTEYQTPCFLAAYIYSVDYPLSVGMPIQEAIAGGMKRVLMDYQEDTQMPRALFSVPTDYRVERMP